MEAMDSDEVKNAVEADITTAAETQDVTEVAQTTEPETKEAQDSDGITTATE